MSKPKPDTSAIIVRRCEPEDAGRIYDLIIQNLQQVLIKDYTDEAVQALVAFYSPDSIGDYCQTQTVLVATLGDEIVGTASLDSDRVRNVFVAATRVRQGIGKMLMKEIEATAEAHGYSKIYLMSAISACRFYEDLGFVIVRRFVHDLNGTPIPEAQMEKVLG